MMPRPSRSVTGRYGAARGHTNGGGGEGGTGGTSGANAHIVRVPVTRSARGPVLERR
jgi:hypothetical protein